MFHVFLSHSVADRPLAQLVQAEVEATKRADVYLAEDHVQLGSPLALKIQAALRSCDAVVALITPQSQASVWVNQEIGYAIRDKPVLPLVMPGVDMRAFGMLAGIEFVRIDPAEPGEALVAINEVIQRKASAKELQQLLAVLVLVGAVVVLARMSEQG